MRSQVCTSQSYSPVSGGPPNGGVVGGGVPVNQFWRGPIDPSRRVVLLPPTGHGTTMSSPGPTPPTPLSHRHSPAVRSAPVSPAPPPPPPPSQTRGHPGSGAIPQSVMHFPHQPSAGVAACQRGLSPDYRSRSSSSHSGGYHQEPGSGMGPRHGSLPRSERSSGSPGDEYAPPSLPPRRNPPPPPPRSGSGLGAPPPPPPPPSTTTTTQPLPSHPAPLPPHHHFPHHFSSPPAPDHQRRFPASVRPSPPQRAPPAAVVPPPPPPPLPEPPISDFVDPEVTSGLLRLLFARFVEPPAASAEVVGDAAPATPTSDLRRVVAHLVRIAHTEIYIQPPPSLQAPSQRCLEASVGLTGGLLEKMEASIYEPGAAVVTTVASATDPVVNGAVGTAYGPAPSSTVGGTGVGSLPSSQLLKRGSCDLDNASLSSTSSTCSSSDSSDMDDDEDEDDISGTTAAAAGVTVPGASGVAQGADYNIYEGVTVAGSAAVKTEMKNVAASAVSGPPSLGGANQKQQQQQQPNSTTLLTVAELHALPQNTTIKCLKASAMQALITLVSACQMDPGLRRRDLDIAQLLARLQLYTMTQSERVVAARDAASGGRLSPDDGQRVAPTHVPVPEVAALVRLSFHPNHRQAICDLGGLHALLSLLRWEHAWWQLRGGASSGSNGGGSGGGSGNDSDRSSLSQVHSTTPPTGSGQGASPLGQSATNTPVGTADLASGDSSVSSASGGAMTTLEASLALRRYICVALTNLTFGAPANKAFVCKRRSHLEALIAQLEVGSEELKQVAASVLRNLSWHTDARSKAALRRVQAATRLTRAVLSAQREATLRTTLNALWNLSSHSTANRKAVCSVNGALAFLVATLDAKNPNKDVEIKANSGGVLRNLCPVIINSLEYRAVLRTHNCISILLEQLRTSPSVTVVVNVCEILGALSATPLREAKPSSALLFESATTDQALMIRLGALEILHRLAHSRHRYVVSSSKQALENLERAHVLMKNQRVVPYPANTDTSSFNNSVATTTNSPVTSNQSSPGAASPASPAEQVYRRRMNNRSHLRFGLLSVVLETNDDFEEEEGSEDEESTSEEDEDGADEIDSVPEEGQSTECSSKVSEAGGEEEAEFKLPEYPSTPEHVETGMVEKSPPPPPPPPAYAQASLEEEEQACVYAEEGTPFGPSARASTLDLRSPPPPPKQQTHEEEEEEEEMYDNFPSQQRRTIHPYVNMDVQQSKASTPKQAACSGVSSPGVPLETPLMFSRASSSRVSSVDFGTLPPIESSPESVYSEEMEDNGEDPNDAIVLGTSPSDLPSSLIGDGKPSKRRESDEKMEEETQIMFAEEGSPLDSNSLSGDRESTVAVPTIWSPPEPAVDSNNILQQCIASVMPSAGQQQQQPPSAVGYPREDGKSETVTTTEDTIHSFAVEGTPFAFSTKNSSLSDVSITDPGSQEGGGGAGGTAASSSASSKSMSPGNSMLKGMTYACSVEDASSVNEAEEEEGSVNLLSEVIQSALPKQGAFAMEAVAESSGDASGAASLSGRSKIGGGSKLVAPRIGFGHPGQQRRPQATVAPMPQVNAAEERTSVVAAETPKSEVKGSSASDADNSSFSSLLSIESVGVETSLLQECISSAMPTPKLPISAKVAAPPLAPIGGPTPSPQPPPPPAHHQMTSATAPITTPVSPESQSSPLAVSEITTSSSTSQQHQQQKRSLLTPPSTGQARKPTGSTASGLRKAGHFLVHGSGTADVLRAVASSPPSSRPETNEQMQKPTSKEGGVQSRLPQMRAPAWQTQRTSQTPTAAAASAGQARDSSSGAARTLRAPRSMSGNASRDTRSTATTSSPPTAVLKPFEFKSKTNDDDHFPLPPPSGNFEADDDSVTLVGDSSPPWRPSPPSTPPPAAGKDSDAASGSDDELLDLDAVLKESEALLEQAAKSEPPKGGLTTPLSIRPPSGTRQIPIPGSSSLRRPTTTGLVTRSKSTASSASSSSSASPQRPAAATRAQSTQPSPSGIHSGLPPPSTTASKLRPVYGSASASSLPRLVSPSVALRRGPSAPGMTPASSTRSLSSSSALKRTPLAATTKPTSSAAVSKPTTGVGAKSVGVKSGLKPASLSTRNTPASAASPAVSQKKILYPYCHPMVRFVIRTGARSEALAEQRMQEEVKVIRGGRKVTPTAARKVSTVTPANHGVVSRVPAAAPTQMVTSSPPQSKLPSLAANSQRRSATSQSPSGLKPPGFASSSSPGLRPPQTRIVKPPAASSVASSMSSSGSSDQWIVRRELTN